jgi:hypothetical protein
MPEKYICAVIGNWLREIDPLLHMPPPPQAKSGTTFAKLRHT